MQMLEPTYPDAALSVQENALLSDELAGQRPVLLLRSNTRIDTGRWLRRSALWLCVTDTDILLLAARKRRYLQRMPIRDCKSSQYCHTSGVLLLEPTDAWRFSTIELPPTDAIKVLKHIEQTITQQPTPVTEPTGA